MGDPLSDAERAALEALEYSEAWLTAGLVSRELLLEQHERMQSGGTRKTAKYRAQALERWRERQTSFDATSLDAFVEAMRNESDKKLASSAVADLISAPALDLAGLEHLARADARLMQKHAPLIRRTYLARRLEAGVTDELMDQMIESKDAALQSPLVRDERLSRKQAERLAHGGANPTIRSNAEAWVRDKKAWK